MTTSIPLVSIILPTYNRAAFLIDSVESVLGQTVSDLELIVIDDGSIDDTVQVMQRYIDDPRVIYHQQDNAGVSKARNNGLAMARGRYIALQDSDDIWLPDKLKHQLPLFEESSRVGLVYGKIAFFDSDTGRLKGEKFEGEQLTHLDVLRHKLPNTQTLVLRREVLGDVEGFLASGVSSGTDFIFCAHVAKDWDIRGTSKLVARVRQHPGQISVPSKRLRMGHRRNIRHLMNVYGGDPACREAISESADYYRWSQFCQLNDAARESWSKGDKFQSFTLRLRAAVCDIRRAMPRPLQALAGSPPREYWGR